MKVFFNASARGKKLYDKEYKVIYKTIESLGYTHTYGLIIQEFTEDKFYGGLKKGGKKRMVDFHKETISLIKSADINVFDCSWPSLGIGYQVEKSLEFNKPTIVLYKEDCLPYFIFGADNEMIIIKKYNKKNLVSAVKKAFEEAKKRKDKRFNFFVSPKILTFIKEHSKALGMTESTYVRGLIIEDMRKY